jgi:membrane protease subunit (stomatin/prohibitin family)
VTVRATGHGPVDRRGEEQGILVRKEDSVSVFLEILEWAVHEPAEMVHRLPEEGSTDVKMGAQLIVQANQCAIFIRDGKHLDELGPGRHVLSTLNLPVLTRVLALPYGCQSPFRAAVLFVNRKVFADLKWGTKNPVVFRDRDLGIVRLRGYGRFSLRISDPILFVNTLVGSRSAFDVTELEDYFRDVIVARLNDLIGERVPSLYDLAALYNELGAAAKVLLRADFQRYGLDLAEFYVNSITPPEAVQRMIDERSSLQAVGNLDDFLRFEAARAIGGHGGGAGQTAGQAVEAGVGAGIGLGLVPSLLRGTPLGAPAQCAPQPAACPECRAGVAADASFCPACGRALAATPPASRDASLPRHCAACNASLPAGARYCPACGRPSATTPATGAAAEGSRTADPSSPDSASDEPRD